VKRHASSTLAETPGQDSFLDVVCNLVGILIVLVMLVAAQAKRSMLAALLKPAATTSSLAEEIRTAQAAAQSLEASIHELDRTIAEAQLETAAREAQRNRYQVLVTVARQRLEEYRAQLSGEEQARYDLAQQLAACQRQWASLRDQAQTLNTPPPKVLEHLPTPMARTVFGTEVHFRLSGHRLAYVPWDEMIQRLKEDAPRHVGKLRDQPRVELSLPDYAGFGARYILRRAEVQIETRVGTATRSGVELEQIYLVETEPNLGQPVQQALAPGSEFRARLSAYKPQNTTVTIWVYPDSFDDFRLVKSELFKMGFLTAARPMPEGEPIAGSPSGTRSVAE
jgi:hypothetical protein